MLHVPNSDNRDPQQSENKSSAVQPQQRIDTPTVVQPQQDLSQLTCPATEDRPAIEWHVVFSRMRTVSQTSPSQVMVERALKHLPDDVRLNNAVEQEKALAKRALSGELDDFNQYTRFRSEVENLVDVKARELIIDHTLRDVLQQTEIMSEFLSLPGANKLLKKFMAMRSPHKYYLGLVHKRFDFLSEARIDVILSPVFQIATNNEFCSERFRQVSKMGVMQVGMLAGGLVFGAMPLACAGVFGAAALLHYEDIKNNRPSFGRCSRVATESRMQFAAESGIGLNYPELSQTGEINDIAKLRALRLLGERPEYYRELYLRRDSRDFESLFNEHFRQTDPKTFAEIMRGYQGAQNIKGCCNKYKVLEIFKKNCQKFLV